MELPSALQSVVSSLRAALAGFTQTSRLLRLQTPLGPEVLLAERLDGVETIDDTATATGEGVSGYRLQITALSTDAHLQPQHLLGQPVLLELLTDQGMADYRPFHGHVTAFEQLGSNGGFARYRLLVEPWLAFLRLRRDSYVFQNLTVIQIVDEVLGDYAGQGALQPAWRWELLDPAAYPVRSLCIQHNESDHDFVMRLLAEEGLFAWFEHGSTQHTWVIADHNGAFGSGAAGASGAELGAIRYQRAVATEAADTLQQFRAKASVGTQAVELASWDYASLDTRSVAHGTAVIGDSPGLTVIDSPGIYRYPDRAAGQRRAQRRAEGLAAQRSLIDASGTVRRMAPGATFNLVDHPRYGALPGVDARDERSRFAVIRLEHHARNNLPADFSKALDTLFATTSQSGVPAQARNDAAPLYQNRLHVHPLTQPYAPLAPEDRPAQAEGQAQPQRLRPRVHGSQTATVVGTDGAPVHTDRDHRIKVQFHFARGGKSSSRLQHPAGDDNAPGNDASGTWVRVATPVAGSNWGGHFIPRIGQEVLIHFLDGDIDRPVVTGALYNGQGTADAPGNQANQTAPAHTANAPAWFAGNDHNAVYSGLKTMALGASQSGQAGYNHLRFDDTPNQSSTQLASTQHQSALTLGHHRGHENGGEGLAGNLRKAGLGHGASMATEAYGAVRGGTGVLISANSRAHGTFGASLQMDAKESIEQLGQAQQLTQSLIDTAKSQEADGTAASAAPSTSRAAAKPAVIEAIETTQKEIKTDAETLSWAGPHLIHGAPGGIAHVTAGVGVYNAGTHFHTTADIGIEVLAQAASRYHVKDGIRLFTYGTKPAGQSPITTQSICLHAAQGQVSLQAQSDEAEIKAKQDVRIASTADQVSVSAKQHVLMTAQGAYLKIEGGTIQLHAPGTVTLKGGQKVFTGPQSQRVQLPSFPRGELKFKHRGSYPFSV